MCYNDRPISDRPSNGAGELANVLAVCNRPNVIQILSGGGMAGGGGGGGWGGGERWLYITH